MRVGGRLNKANLPYEQKHPILLQQNKLLTVIIIRYFHLTNCHGGKQTSKILDS